MNKPSPQYIEMKGCSTVYLVLKLPSGNFEWIQHPEFAGIGISFGISRESAAIQRGVLDTGPFVALIGTLRIFPAYPVVEQF